MTLFGCRQYRREGLYGQILQIDLRRSPDAGAGNDSTHESAGGVDGSDHTHYSRKRMAVLSIFKHAFMILVILGILGPNTWNWNRVTFITLCLSSLYSCLPKDWCPFPCCSPHPLSRTATACCQYFPTASKMLC